MKDNLLHSMDVTTNVINSLSSSFKLEGDYQHMKSTIHPIISNAMFHREKELLEEERFTTLIALAKVLDDDNIHRAITALKYQLTKK